VRSRRAAEAVVFGVLIAGCARAVPPRDPGAPPYESGWYLRQDGVATKVGYDAIFVVRDRVVTRKTFYDDMLDVRPGAPLSTTHLDGELKVALEIIPGADGTLTIREQYPQRPLAMTRLVRLRDEPRRAALEAIVRRAEDPATCRDLAQRCAECVPRASYGNFVDPLKCWNGLVALDRLPLGWFTFAQPDPRGIAVRLSVGETLFLRRYEVEVRQPVEHLNGLCMEPENAPSPQLHTRAEVEPNGDVVLVEETNRPGECTRTPKAAVTRTKLTRIADGAKLDELDAKVRPFFDAKSCQRYDACCAEHARQDWDVHCEHRRNFAAGCWSH
jgi:hypothetical protein